MSCFDGSTIPSGSSVINLTWARSATGKFAKRMPNNTFSDDEWVQRLDHAILAAGHEFCKTTQIYQAEDTTLATVADTATVDASGVTAMEYDKLLDVSLINSDGYDSRYTIVGEPQVRGGNMSIDRQLVSITQGKILRFYPTPSEVSTVRLRYWKPFEMDLGDIGTPNPDAVTFALPLEVAYGVMVWGAVSYFDQDVRDKQYGESARSKFERHMKIHMGYGQERVKAVYADRSRY